ncbi:GNAT family N-acetyltransferase [uncultured Cellulomonas sp.]|uniref:GNAT family N-acetyltransferase n=1 Tax=uncultured Cellulomonas sp. TaxID=189682 RepID=UPI00261DCFBF|nr:GNAT family N-acetyltransferase [uncultured Cellulomonas sp.]
MHPGDRYVLRPMAADDVDTVLDVQEPGAVTGLAEVFPQHLYPFPRRDVAERWLRELQTPGTDCYVVVRDAVIAGFAAVRGDELLHFGIAVEQWGTGLAQWTHDAVLDEMRGRGVGRAWLTVYTANRRGRRFYERLGWHPTGDRTRGSTAPFAELLRYERALTGDSAEAPAPGAGTRSTHRPGMPSRRA